MKKKEQAAPKTTQPTAEEKPKDTFFAISQKQLEAVINYFLDHTATRVGSQYIAMLNNLPALNVKSDDGAATQS